MLDALEADGATRARLYAPAYAQGATLACALAPRDGCDGVAVTAARLGAGDAGALAAAERWFEGWRSARERELAAAAAWRGGLRVGVVGALLLALGVAARRGGFWPPRVAWATPALLFATYAAFLAVRGYRLTFSKMPQQADFVRDATLASICAVAAALAFSYRVRAPASGIATLAGVVAPFACCAAWAGIDHASLRPPFAGLAVILAAPALVAAAVAAVVMLLRERVSGARPRASAAPAP
jgi:hypothetical protein